MFISANAFFEDHTDSFKRVLIRSQETIPIKWLAEYKKAARGDAPGVIAAPMKSGALRKSIITRPVGNKGEVSWRSDYAAAQNVGRHTQHMPVQGWNRRDGGYATIGGGRTYMYGRYTAGGTGRGFASAAYRYANSQLPQIVRGEGLTK
jgi:hypothetical protein